MVTAETNERAIVNYSPSEALDSLDAEVVEKLVVEGDLKGLTSEQRVMYYTRLCESLGLNPLNRPFQYITLNNKLTLYATKIATEQVRANWGMTEVEMTREVIEGMYVVTATYETAGGRRESSTGVVAIDGLKGEARANAMMKAETKAKRRVTIALCGLGFLDETEVATIPNAKFYRELDDGRLVDEASGEVVDAEVKEPPGDDKEFLNVAKQFADFFGLDPIDTSQAPWNEHDLKGRKRVLYAKIRNRLLDAIGNQQTHDALDGLMADWHDVSLNGVHVWDDKIREAYEKQVEAIESES